MLTLRPVAALAIAAMLLTNACAPIEAAPPRPPAMDLPAIDASFGPPAPGKQRIVLDTPGDHARVTESVGSLDRTSSGGTTVVGERVRTICITPCAVDLSYGAHDLHFASTTNDERSADHTVQLQGSPLAVREVLDETRNPNPAASGASTAFAASAVMALVAGSVLGVAGVAQDNTPSSHDDGVHLEQTAAVTLGVGAAFAIAAIVFSYVGRSEHVPSTTTEWALPRTDGG